jgi:hypothetical protein
LGFGAKKFQLLLLFAKDEIALVNPISMNDTIIYFLKEAFTLVSIVKKCSEK